MTKQQWQLDAEADAAHFRLNCRPKTESTINASALWGSYAALSLSEGTATQAYWQARQAARLAFTAAPKLRRA